MFFFSYLYEKNDYKFKWIGVKIKILNKINFKNITWKYVKCFFLEKLCELNRKTLVE